MCNKKYSEIEKRRLTERIELLSEQFLNTKETHTKQLSSKLNALSLLVESEDVFSLKTFLTNITREWREKQGNI